MPGYGKALIIGLITAMIGIIIAIAGVWKEPTPFWIVGEHSWLLRRRGPIAAPSEITLIAINRQAADQLEQPREISQWPRSLHAKLIDRLVQQDASVIVFDIAFMDVRSDEEDGEFAKAIEQAARVVLLAEIDLENPYADIEEVEKHHALKPPNLKFVEAARGYGLMPMPKTANVFRFWTFKEVGGEVPTLPAVALQLYALPILNHFSEILENAGFQITGLPQNPSDIRNAEDLRDLMHLLRREFRKNPLMRKGFMSALELESEEMLSDGERKLLEALANLYGGSSYIYLNYYGPPATIETISYDRVLLPDRSGTVDQLDLSGKVVFVGSLEFSSTEQEDAYPTAFSKADGTYLSGVEIAATAFANLLSQNMLQVHMPTHLGILLFFGFLVGNLGFLVPGVRSIVVAVIVGAVYFSVAFFLFVKHSFWVPVFIPLLFQIPIALFLGLICQYICTRREKEKLLPWVPEKIVNFPEAGLFYGTCLLTDIRGSREISSALTPSEYKSLMTGYFTRIEKTVSRNGGYQWDTYGDGAMYLFTARQSEAALRRAACQGALDIYREIESFNQEQSEGIQLPTCIGLHAGWMEFGEGTRERTLGDVGNTVRSIEELNKLLSTRILASEAAVEGISDCPSGQKTDKSLTAGRKNNQLLRRLGAFILKGKADPMTIFEVMDCEKNRFEITRKRLELFAEALDAFEKRQWQKAAEFFDEILSQYPKDGPSLLYLQRCHLYLQDSPPSSDPSIIRIET